MKFILLPFLLTFYSCSMNVETRLIDWEELAYLNGHSFNEDTDKDQMLRHPADTGGDRVEDDKCSDQTEEELANLDSMILRFNGKIVGPEDYDFTVDGLQRYIEDSGLTKYFSAKEMVKPNNRSVAKSCNYSNLLPSRCRWKSAVAQGLLAVELRKEINKNSKKETSITLRNWWRPTCYNSQVGGAKASDHIQARGFDLDFKTAKQRAVAQSYLCKMYKEGSPLSLQVGIGCQTLHIGVGSPKRLSRYPDDGSRFWKYGSLGGCSIKRITGDDCWKQGHDGKLYIYPEDGGSGVL